jgi:asparagine synthase (glutamine-hydrolysing)
MCGICGMAGFVDEALLARMNDIVAHRGPDDQGTYVSPSAPVALGNRRLSILDLSEAGHMPMANQDGSVVVSYNGEIYNAPELRRDLEAQGHRFRSRSDTEVLIHGYEEWGDALPCRLNGMFAFALWDEPKQTLVLVRDRLGIKPLYWTETASGLLFASEVKSLLCCNEVERRVDVENLWAYLSFLWVPGPETLFDGIQKLPPAHMLRWADGAATISRYWQQSFDPLPAAAGEPREALRRVLEGAVGRQLRSDVPVGIFLSGGIDSSGIAAMAAQVLPEPPLCLTITFRSDDARLEQSSDDPKYARLLAESIGATYEEIEVSPDIVDLLPEVVWHQDEPIADPAAINTLLISRSASSRAKVLLSGQGADEVFAGYNVYRMHGLAESLSKLPGWVVDDIVAPVVERLPSLADSPLGVRPGLMLAAHRNLSKLLQGMNMPPQERFVFYRSYYRDDDRDVLAPLLASNPGLRSSFDRHSAYFKEVENEDFLTQMLHVDQNTFLPELNLAYCDKMSMAASVETRVPYLDNEVVDFMARVPSNLKLHGLTSKHLLREAFRGVVPDPILRRRKAAFSAPIRTWLRKDLREMVDDLLSPEVVARRGYFRYPAVRRMIDDDRAGKQDNSLRIWALLTLEIWQRTFIDGPAA